MPLLLALVFFAGTLHALTLDRQKLDAELAKADAVADILVTDLTYAPDPVVGFRHRALARVEAVVSGNLPSDIVLEGPGGEGAGIGVHLTGFNRPYVRHHYRAHLATNPDGTYRVVGYHRGLVDKSGTRGFTRNRTDGSNGEGVGAFLFWDESSFPVPYFISAKSFRGKSDFVPAIDQSFRTWRNLDGVKVEFVGVGCSDIARNENDGVNNVIFVEKDWQFGAAAIAITRNFYVSGEAARSGQILDSDILLNGVDHVFSTNNTLNTHDVQNIVTHEVGHFLGLGHDGPSGQENEDAVMFAVAKTNEFKKRTLHPNDIAGIREAYAGSGTKYAPSNAPTCQVPDGAVQCAAVHGSGGLPWLGLTLSLLWWLGTVWLGRRLISASPSPSSPSR